MTVDIVNLIESNPITKFTGSYQCKLIEKVKNNFNNYEQQMFLSSFYCYLKYDSKKDFVIDLDNIWKWLDFSNKAHAKTLLLKHFSINIDYIFLLTKKGEQKEETRGGHNKEIIMLNLETFKKFCLKSGTKKADEIHDYFIKLERVLQEILQEESEELKKQLLQIEDKKNKELEEKLQKQKLIEREKVLLDKFSNSGSLIYIIKVHSYNNGTYVIKLGHSEKGVLDRYNQHKTNFNECLLLECFLVNKSRLFEQYLHDHVNIRLNKVTDLLGHEKEKELFLIGKNLTYNMVLNIIDNNIQNFNYTINELLKENELLKHKLQNGENNSDNNLLLELTQTVKYLSSKIDNLEKLNKEILSKISVNEIKITTGFKEPLNTLGPRLQKINPENLQLIKIYENVTEAMKENSNIKRPSINKAIIENTIYCGFRWLLVDRELDPNIIHNIKPTKETKTQNLGYIAKLNEEQTEIVNVYIDRKTASHLNGYDSISALDNPVKKCSLSKGYYYKLYNDCKDELRYKFEEKKGTPLLYKQGIGQYDIQNNLVKEFACKYDCIKTLYISDKTLNKCLEKNISYNGYYYKEITSKLVC
jgi:hypothetical protein